MLKMLLCQHKVYVTCICLHKAGVQLSIWQCEQCKHIVLSEVSIIMEEGQNEGDLVGNNLDVVDNGQSPSVSVNKWFAQGADYNYTTNACNEGKKCSFYKQVRQLLKICGLPP